MGNLATKGTLALIVWLALACGGGEETPRATPAATTTAAASAETPSPPVDLEAAREEARTIFSTRCFTCHGPEGAGDGPGAAALMPKPRNFQDPGWQGSVSDEHIETIIQHGGAAVGRSPMMPPNPDLTGKPEVLAALRQHIRGLVSE